MKQMDQVRGTYFLEGNRVKPTRAFYDFLNQPGVYVFEVVRLINGIPLFLEEHLERLQLSAFKTGVGAVINVEELKNAVTRLIHVNKAGNSNLKIVIHVSQGKVNFRVYFIPFYYPSEEDYLNGVKVGILHAERTNPEAKTIQPDVRETANQMIRSGKMYEVLLVDKEGFIREGSRSNVFFIQDEKVVTPPAETVLNGITRQKIMTVLKNDGCSFEEVPVRFENLSHYQCVFLTGTSPKVLPVSSVGNCRFEPGNKLCRYIMKKYDRLVDEYLVSVKKTWKC